MHIYKGFDRELHWFLEQPIPHYCLGQSGALAQYNPARTNEEIQ
jgi:hypothetical protein